MCKKVKCPLVQALILCTGRTAHRGSRCIVLLFIDHDTRRGWGVSVTPRPLFTPGKDPVPIVQEAWWAPGSVWTGAENLAPTGIRSPDRPARSQSLYRLRYPAHRTYVSYLIIGLEGRPCFCISTNEITFACVPWCHFESKWRLCEIGILLPSEWGQPSSERKKQQPFLAQFWVVNRLWIYRKF